MPNVSQALKNIQQSESEWKQHPTLSFSEFLEELSLHPERVIRNIYQYYADMFHTYVTADQDEYHDDPESINYVNYDSSRLFVENSDRPFFADRLFANRLARHVESLSVGAQQNKIYIFEGPHGSGKSTFLNNLLRKFEEYSRTSEGKRYETVWRLKRDHLFGGMHSFNNLTDRLAWYLENEGKEDLAEEMRKACKNGDELLGDHIEIACPSHDNPILHIPKNARRRFFDDLLENEEFKWKLFTEKKYEWVFLDTPCTVCMSLYQSLMRLHNDPRKVLDMVYARPYIKNRRVGEGISVYNPGDKPLSEAVLRNEMVQRSLDILLSDSDRVDYIYSSYAKTNDGIYALMDIKSHNTERLMELHNIISDGVHKVENTEEYVNSLLLALMNPEDKMMLKDLQAFSDRIEYINVPYILDLKTEVEIYRNTFGKHIDESFLPRVLHNFARVIIATRLHTKSEAMLDWIGDPGKYDTYCDQNLQLLKMEIYTGHIPKWLSEEDLKSFTAKRRQKIIAESERDGWKGLSGRDSLKMFNEFYADYFSEDKLIDMSMLVKFFKKYCKQDKNILPPGFLDSVQKMYNYGILQEVKESLYYYNEAQISRSIQNYMFAVNFEPGTIETCRFTGDKIEVTDEFFQRIESKLLSQRSNAKAFRADVQKKYTSVTLPQEILRDNLDITKTSLFKQLHSKYIHNLKEKVLEPFLKNENFRMAVKDFGSESFKTYDKKIRYDVTYMIENLQKKFQYSHQGAKEICIYVIDNNLASFFSRQRDL
ncbi:serine protein kinase PrkA [Desulfopila inferna]|uniref:serine protein kinase PrkA n=1 Tax=Desulfopila inferna TaxID=468528 RepID=UPI0019665109|nr:serine protein kinase PrkA [Desulfopila inferna]MBM9606379.1 serine protein kinase PrkA [Desulfopila inferna]